MDKKYLNILEVPEVDFNSTDRLVVIDVSNNIKVLGKESLNVDLSDYYTKEATNELLNNKADKITVTELAAKLKGDTDKLNKDITDLGNRVDSIPVITVDAEMNSESTNPVQNKAITNTITNLSNSVDEKLSNKQPKGDYALKSDIAPLATKSEVAEDVAQLNASLNEKQPKGDYALRTEIPTKVSQLSNDSNYQTAEDVNLATAGLATKAEVNSKQDTLVSGTNIKTINGNSLLGSGNIEIQGGSTIAVDDSLSTTSTNPVQNKIITEALNGKASQSDIPTKVSELTNDSDFQTASQVAAAISGINVPTKVSQLDNDSDFQTGTQVSNSISTATSGLATKAELAGKQDKGDYATTAQLNGKQDTLVSGTNIKTVNGNSLLGEGNILIKSVNVDSALSTTSENPVQNKVITNKVNTIEQSITNLSNTMPTKVSDLTNDSGYITNAALTDLATKEEVSAKQDTLVSGTNIKTINGNSILGAGNIEIQGGGGGGDSTPDVIINVGDNSYTTTPTSFSYTFEKGDYLSLKNLCKSKRNDKIKITQFGIASGCDDDSFWLSFAKGTSTYTYRFTDISENTIKIQLIVTGTITVIRNGSTGKYSWDAYYTTETNKSVIESIINGYVIFTYHSVYSDGSGSCYIFSKFESSDKFNTNLTATMIKSYGPGSKNFETIDVTVNFTPDSVVITGQNW